jgi:hypothetical protein
VSVFAKAREEHLPLLREWGRRILTTGSLPLSLRPHDPQAVTAGEDALP